MVKTFINVFTGMIEDHVVFFIIIITVARDIIGGITMLDVTGTTFAIVASILKFLLEYKKVNSLVGEWSLRRS